MKEMNGSLNVLPEHTLTNEDGTRKYLKITEKGKKLLYELYEEEA